MTDSHAKTASLCAVGEVRSKGPYFSAFALWPPLVIRDFHSISLPSADRLSFTIMPQGVTSVWTDGSARNREIIAESCVLIFVDDILHYYNGVGIEGKSIRDKLHEDLCKNGLPPLKSHELSAKNSITFL